jgi:hypothetical protein
MPWQSRGVSKYSSVPSITYLPGLIGNADSQLQHAQTGWKYRICGAERDEEKHCGIILITSSNSAISANTFPVHHFHLWRVHVNQSTTTFYLSVLGEPTGFFTAHQHNAAIRTSVGHEVHITWRYRRCDVRDDARSWYHSREVPGSIPGRTGHYHHVAAVGKLLTLNCFGGGTKRV